MEVYHLANKVEYVKKYQEKCDAIMLRPSKERGERIRKAAAASGMSVQAFVLKAVEKEIETTNILDQWRKPQ